MRKGFYGKKLTYFNPRKTFSSASLKISEIMDGDTYFVTAENNYLNEKYDYYGLVFKVSFWKLWRLDDMVHKKNLQEIERYWVAIIEYYNEDNKLRTHFIELPEDAKRIYLGRIMRHFVFSHFPVREKGTGFSRFGKNKTEVNAFEINYGVDEIMRALRSIDAVDDDELAELNNPYRYFLTPEMINNK